MLREVDPCSPAEQVGMEDGDLLLSVNGEPIEMAEHEDIVSKVRQSGQQVTLTCISLNGREFYEKVCHVCKFVRLFLENRPFQCDIKDVFQTISKKCDNWYSINSVFDFFIII